MPNNLTNEILLHVFSNLGVVVPTKVPLQSSTFLLPETISLDFDDGEKKLKLWGTEVDINSKKLKMLLTDLTDNKNEKEYALVVQLDDCPAYGCYLCLESTVIDKNVPRHGLIFFSLQENTWVATNTYLQASFLAGMEQLKDVLSTWNKSSDNESMVNEMKALVELIFQFEEQE